MNELTELILSQPTVGTTIKTDGIESDPFALFTVLNMHLHHVRYMYIRMKINVYSFDILAKRLHKSHCQLYPFSNGQQRPCVSRDTKSSVFAIRSPCRSRALRTPRQYASSSGTSNVWHVSQWDKVGQRRCLSQFITCQDFQRLIPKLQGEPYHFTHLLFISRVYHLTEDEESMLANAASSRRPRTDALSAKNKKQRPPDAQQNGAGRPVDGIYSYHPEDDIILNVRQSFPLCVLLSLNVRSKGGHALDVLFICCASASISAGNAWPRRLRSRRQGSCDAGCRWRGITAGAGG